MDDAHEQRAQPWRHTSDAKYSTRVRRRKRSKAEQEQRVQEMERRFGRTDLFTDAPLDPRTVELLRKDLDCDRVTINWECLSFDIGDVIRLAAKGDSFVCKFKLEGVPSSVNGCVCVDSIREAALTVQGFHFPMVRADALDGDDEHAASVYRVEITCRKA